MQGPHGKKWPWVLRSTMFIQLFGLRDTQTSILFTVQLQPAMFNFVHESVELGFARDNIWVANALSSVKLSCATHIGNEIWSWIVHSKKMIFVFCGRSPWKKGVWLTMIQIRVQKISTINKKNYLFSLEISLKVSKRLDIQSLNCLLCNFVHKSFTWFSENFQRLSQALLVMRLWAN